MNAIAPINQTMLSKDLLEIINTVRAEMGEPIIRLNKFNEKIEDELDGEHYTKSVVQNSNNTTSIIYELTIDQCTLIGMRESKSVRKSVLAKLKAKHQTFLLPQTFAQALALAAEQAKELEEAHAKVELLQPKAQALEVLSQNRNGYLCLTDAAKHLHVKVKDLTNLLANKKFIYRRATSSPLKKGKWAAYERAIQKGWLFHDYVAGEKPDGTDYAPQVLVTPKGLALIAEIVSQEKGILV